MVDEQGRRRGDRRLADAGDDRHRLVAVEQAAVEGAPDHELGTRTVEVGKDRVELLVHRREDPDPGQPRARSWVWRRGHA